MKILTKYLLIKNSYYLLISSAILVGLIFALQATKLLGLFIDSSAGVLSFLYLVTTSLPGLLQEILPIIAFLTTILFVNSLHSNNEATIMRAVGLNEFVVYKSVFSTLLFITIINIVITNNLIPSFEEKYRVARHNLNSNAIDLLIAQHKQNKVIPIRNNESLYIESIDKQGNIKNMVLYTPSENREVTVISETGKISKDTTNAPILFLQNAKLITLSEDSYSQLVLKEYIVYLQDIFDTQKNLVINHMSRKNMTLMQLLLPKILIANKLEKLKLKKLVPENRTLTLDNLKTYNTEAYRRLLNIINCFAFGLIALLFVGGNNSGRKENNYAIIKALGCILLLRILQLSFVFNSNGNLYILFFTILATAIACAFVFFKILKKAQPQA